MFSHPFFDRPRPLRQDQPGVLCADWTLSDVTAENQPILVAIAVIRVVRKNVKRKRETKDRCCTNFYCRLQSALQKEALFVHILDLGILRKSDK